MKHSINSLSGCVVRAKDGDVGTVEQFYFYDLTWCVRYMAVRNSAERSSRSYLIAVTALAKPDWKKRVFPVDLTLDQVRSSPDADLADPVARQHEEDLHRHYAWPIYWSGAFYTLPDNAFAPGPLLDDEPDAGIAAARLHDGDPNLRSTRDVETYRVHATDGSIGQVEDFLADDAWVIRYLVVNTRRWLADRLILVSPEWIAKVNWAEKEVLVDLKRDAVRQSPRYDPLKTLRVGYEDKLLVHFQKPDTREWVIFKFHAAAGLEVHVAGTFNNWDPTDITLADNGKGTYTASVLLPLGTYEYKYIVNGNWCNASDVGERVPNVFGTTNGLLVVARAALRPAYRRTFPRLAVTKEQPLYTAPLAR